VQEPVPAPPPTSHQHHQHPLQAPRPLLQLSTRPNSQHQGEIHTQGLIPAEGRATRSRRSNSEFHVGSPLQLEDGYSVACKRSRSERSAGNAGAASKVGTTGGGDKQQQAGSSSVAAPAASGVRATGSLRRARASAVATGRAGLALPGCHQRGAGWGLLLLLNQKSGLLQRMKQSHLSQSSLKTLNLHQLTLLMQQH
jgi:hypothetical protein